MWRSHGVKLLALLLLVVAYAGLYPLVPPRHRVAPHWGSDAVNWFGQGPGRALLNAAAILALLCCVRYPITVRSASAASALAWYGLLLASLLPCVWLLVAIDWDNEAVAPAGNWVGTPVALFGLPTAVLAFDLSTATRLTPRLYGARCLVEVLVLVPIWAVAWCYCEILLLGWVGF
jgi:hypothetical protein